MFRDRSLRIREPHSPEAPAPPFPPRCRPGQSLHLRGGSRWLSTPTGLPLFPYSRTGHISRCGILRISLQKPPRACPGRVGFPILNLTVHLRERGLPLVSPPATS